MRRRLLASVPVVAVVVAAGGLSAAYAVRATHWAVMTDELQTLKLATSIGDDLSLVPRIHGIYYGAYGQLYPLLLAPFARFLAAPTAVEVAHGLNGFLLASAAWPAYLVARRVTGSRGAGYLAAGLTAFTPWLVLSSTLLSEPAAYPAFVWAIFFAHRALAAPSIRNDLLALAGLLLAFFARTQLFVVALGLAAALVLHELAFAAAGADASSPRRLRTAAAGAATRHPVLLAGYLAAGAFALALASLGRIGALFGNYEGASSGDLFPPGLWRAAAEHLTAVIVGGGGAPFLLSFAWVPTTLLRPRSREAHAFAALLVALGPLLTLEAASFDLRFTPGGFIQDRYLCYLAPLLAVGAAALLCEQRVRTVQAALVLVAGGVAAVLAGLSFREHRTVIFWAAPAAAFEPALTTVAHALRVSLRPFLILAVVLLAAALAAVLLRWPRIQTLLAVSGMLVVFGLFEAIYVFERFAVPGTTGASTPVGVSRDWIDAATHGHGSVALLPSPYLGGPFWWDAELWNKSVKYVLRFERGPTYTPFPSTPLTLDLASGRLRGPEPTDLLLRARSDTRIRLAEQEVLLSEGALTLVRVRRPYHAIWATRNADPDGWMRPHEPVRLRLYPPSSPGRRRVIVTVSAPPEAIAPATITLRNGSRIKRVTIAPGSFSRLRFTTCLRTKPVDVALTARGRTRLPDRRLVTLHIDDIHTTSLRHRC